VNDMTIEEIKQALLKILSVILSLKQEKPMPESTPPPQQTPPTPPTPEVLRWDTPQRAWHATRVRCDVRGLNLTQKNTLCACIYQESRFLANPKPNKNIDPRTGKVWSTDYGIVQINDYWHIGAGKDFPNVEYVISRPETGVEFMIDEMVRTGALRSWSSYTSGAYRQWLPLTSSMWNLATRLPTG
jgi:hypothetical protein